MRLADVVTTLGATVICGETLLDREVDCGIACDLMSDALTYAGPRILFLTGLTNPQVIRTAELIDCSAVVFVRGRRPVDAHIRTIAQDKRIPLLTTDYSMYEACALLHAAGLKGAALRERRA
ncbi:MAG: DRTGG domain-containing protein [Chloroflexota bacterium]